MANVSFANDIRPLFTQFRAQMLWRMDLTSYDHVKTNAALIYSRITSTGDPMPAAPFDPLTREQIDMFQTWMNQGCPP